MAPLPEKPLVIEEEKQISDGSSQEGSSSDDALPVDKEKIALAQVPVAGLADEPAIPLTKLDSRRPKSIKEQREEQEKKDKDASIEDALAHLPPHEAAILRRQIEVPPVKVNFGGMFRYATRNDIIIFVISAFGAIAGGAALPLMTVIFGSLSGKFSEFGQGKIGNFSDTVNHLVLYFVYLGVGEFFAIYISTVGFIYAGEHIAGKIRNAYLTAILRQNIGYFDKLGAGEITTRITSDTNLVQDGISEKLGLTLTAVATFVTAYVVAYVRYWKLALILSSSIVAMVLTMGSLIRFLIKWNKASLAHYAEGGTIAEEVLSSIRNATAFGTQNKLARQYDEQLTAAGKFGFKLKALQGSLIGIIFMYIYFTYALAFWLGSKYLIRGECGLSQVLTIMMCIMIGSFSLGNIAPNIQAFTTSMAAASKIYATIDRVSPLDPASDEGETLDHVEGAIELRNIKHIYPSRPEVVVMEDISLNIPAGKTTALVGASGSGKSTIVGLVERFYDPVGGTVLLDGHDIQTLNLRFLRNQISLVSQEPTLFATTIAGNIRHGLIGTKYEYLPDEETWELVENAARMANAHDFICQLPEGYETNVGERGFLLSGGQKQRIAIARAIVCDPKILLLDEATSALDTKSEGVVQAALDKAAKGRTTIVIAHRLSTIKHSNNIVVMSNGRIVEQGTHDELLDLQSAYYELVQAQKIAHENEKKKEAEEASLHDGKVGAVEKSLGLEEAELVDYEVDPDDLKLSKTKTAKSVSSVAMAKQPEVEAPEYSLWTLIKVIASYNSSEVGITIVGLIFVVICGAGNPTQAVFFAKSIVALALPPTMYQELRSEANFWSWMYFMLAVVQAIAFLVQGSAFAYTSEKLVHRARDTAFRTMLRQEIAYFDREENSAGALTSFLSTETTHLAGMTGVTLSTIISVLTTLIASFVVALAVGWKLSLVCISTVPIVVGCGYYRFQILTSFHGRAKRSYEQSASYACEATSAIRTVASLSRERDVIEHYGAQITAQEKKSLLTSVGSSALYAASSSLMFLCMALAFWYGSTLLASGEYGLFQFFLCFSAVIFGSQSAGTVFSFAPDMGKARHAANEFKILTDRVPEIDTWSTDGLPVEHCEGNIEFRGVHFRYPSRPEQPVLRGLDLTVKHGQYVALVGPSGCGKSTTIGLLERFYDPLVGGVFVDGKEIKSLNVNDYRRHLALVSQEPTLYQGTIKDNILLGADRPEEEVTDAMITQACKDANIYDFIMSLPEGFNTVVGSKGSMLSGGQKQRVAIARALLRDPKILLLDEATSALDSESEKVVQAALDSAAKGRTTIAVAHRLSTIQKADIIYVFDNGRIVEKGNHQELISQQGRYFELVNMQSLGKTQI